MASNTFSRMSEWFSSYDGGAAWDQLGSSTFRWPVPEAVEALPPATEPGAPFVTRGHQRVDDPIAMAFVKPSVLLAEVGSWFRQQQLVSEGEAWVAGNAEKRPAVAPMHADEYVFQPEHDKGHCWALALSSRSVLTRRTAVRHHTRVVPWHFTMPGPASAKKIYAYHAMAFSAAYINEINRVEKPDEPNYLPISYTLEDLQTVTKGKQSTSNVLCHACGNAFCENVFHLKIATKDANDEEEFCHHFLRKMSTNNAFSSFRQNVCLLFHASPAGVCWCNNYHEEVTNPDRLSVSQQVPFEDLQEAVEEGEQDPGVV